jgi:hydrogenase maturation protease
MPARIVIGIGHRDRGDDAVGRIVAARLREQALCGVTVLDHDGEPAMLVEWLSQAGDAILVDAALTGASPGTVRRFDVTASPLPCGKAGLSTHGMGLAEAIELSRTLGTLPVRCVVYAIEARSFEHGFPLTAEVDRAVDEVVACILNEFHGRTAPDA